MTRRRAKLARAGFVLLTLVVAVIGALWLEHRLPIELATPTGPFALGRAHYGWDGGLNAWIWYPAADRAAPDDYLPDTIRAEWQQVRPALINFLTRDFANVHSHSARDVAVSNQQRPFPVVILRGGGAGAALNYSSLAQDLASHGYVVVGLDMAVAANPELCAGRSDDAACATELMLPLIDGIGSALDHLHKLTRDDARFGGTLDLTRVGVFGHSFGGAQAAQFCSQDARCKAGINIDGRPFGTVIATGIRVPFMFLLSDHGTPEDEVSRRILSDIQSIYDRQPPDTRVRVAIRGAHHFTFSDDGALLKSRLFRGVLRLFGVLGMDGRRQIDVTAYVVRTFFDAHLKHATRGRAMLASPDFPEVIRFEP